MQAVWVGWLRDEINKSEMDDKLNRALTEVAQHIPSRSG